MSRKCPECLTNETDEIECGIYTCLECGEIFYEEESGY